MLPGRTEDAQAVDKGAHQGPDLGPEPGRDDDQCPVEEFDEPGCCRQQREKDQGPGKQGHDETGQDYPGGARGIAGTVELPHQQEYRTRQGGEGEERQPVVDPLHRHGGQRGAGADPFPPGQVIGANQLPQPGRQQVVGHVADDHHRVKPPNRKQAQWGEQEPPT